MSIPSGTRIGVYEVTAQIGADGKELFFIGATSLMRVPIRYTGTLFDAGNAEAIFELPFRLQAFTTTSNVFSVSPDGQRFLFNVPLDDRPNPLKLIVNWPERLRR